MAALLLAFSGSSIHAQAGRFELHPIQTHSPTDQEFLTGQTGATSATVAGVLRLPSSGNDPLPAVILVHGSGGPSALDERWATEVQSLGAAAFVLDGFTGRGIVSTVADQAQLGRLAMILDIYRALDVLARHPRIDPARIAVMGFSRGGQAALYSSLNRFRAMHGPTRDLQLAAYIALYPTCNTVYRAELAVSDNPIRVFHGTADDYVPVAPCRAYVERLRQAGKDVLLTEYPEAHHVFDNPALTTPLKLPHAQTTRNCQLEEGPEGRIITSGTKQVFSYDDACVERGTTVAYHAQAHAAARTAIAAFLKAALKLN